MKCTNSNSPLAGTVGSEKELWDIHHIYDAPPRNLKNFAHEPNIYDRIVNEEMNELSPQDFTKLLQAGDNSHLLVSTEQSSTDRTSPERKIVSICPRKNLRTNPRELDRGDKETLRCAKKYLNHVHCYRDDIRVAGPVFQGG